VSERHFNLRDGRCGPPLRGYEALNGKESEDAARLSHKGSKRWCRDSRELSEGDLNVRWDGMVVLVTDNVTQQIIGLGI